MLKDYMTAKALLESPVLKVLEAEMQEQILSFKVHHAGPRVPLLKMSTDSKVRQEEDPEERNTTEYEAHMELFLSETALRVIRHFQNEIVSVRRKQNVTFKNMGRVHDAIFNPLTSGRP